MSAMHDMQSLVAPGWHAAPGHASSNALADRALGRDERAGYVPQHYPFIAGIARLSASAVVHALKLAIAVPDALFPGSVRGLDGRIMLPSGDKFAVVQ